MDKVGNDLSTRGGNTIPVSYTVEDGMLSKSEWAQLVRHFSLPRRQAEIVRLLFAGYSDRQIATELEIEVCTVREYMSRLFTRFGVRGRTRLTIYLFRQFRQNSHAKGRRVKRHYSHR